ncbi:VOC family protein [Vibrio sonorensis]|uniref:VOC family protein n=1 Tax=Vibrio sonorensis TaxID=1004316 RepID=UPI0008D97D64|nr:VOC family protein [Vibrio sonorensis]
MNLNQVSIPVKDMEEACEFYLTLGFIQIVETAHYARFACPQGDATFCLVLEPAKAANASTLYFEHEHLDAWVTRLKKVGIQFEQDPTDHPYLWREAKLTDPSGNNIKLYWAGKNRLEPPWKVDIRV